MNWMQRAVLAGLAGVLVFLPACKKTSFTVKGPGPGHHYGQQSPRVFEVYIYADPAKAGKCLEDWPVGTLWQGKHQTVLWISDDGGEYTVDFNKGHHQPPTSPFSATTFHVPSNGETPSNDLQAGASGYYDYAIHFGDANGAICKDTGDPGWYVNP